MKIYRPINALAWDNHSFMRDELGCLGNSGVRIIEVQIIDTNGIHTRMGTLGAI